MRIEFHRGHVTYHVTADIDAGGNGSVTVRRGAIELGVQLWVSGRPGPLVPALTVIADDLVAAFRVARAEAVEQAQRPKPE